MKNYDENVQKINADLQQNGTRNTDTPEWICWRTGLSFSTIMDTLNKSIDDRDGHLRCDFTSGRLKIEGRS